MFDNSYLTSSAVEAVRRFLSDQVPLSQSIADIASRDSLNAEQIKRVVETVNQVAYLKMQQEASDQTFEFPLATVEDVSHLLIAPSSGVDLTKSASFDLLGSMGVDTGHSKQASDDSYQLQDSERYHLIYKKKLLAEAELEKKAHEERELIINLHNQIVLCRKDPDTLEKIAYLTDDDEDAIKATSKMLTGMVKSASCKQIFYEEDLGQTRRLLGLIKQAYSLQEAKTGLSNSINKANEFLKPVTTPIKDQWARAKPMMPNKLAMGLTAPFYESKQPIWGSLQKTME